MSEKTLQMHLADYKAQMIQAIREREISPDIRADELINIGLDIAIEAVQETEYEVTK